MRLTGQPSMSPEEFRLIREFVAENFGLVLDDGKENYLAGKLRSRLQELKLANFIEYYSHLKFSPDNGREHHKFISLITNNETYFFRQKPQLDIFAGEIIPSLKEKKLKSDEKRIRIVSAGCSSGEEVYTLAMLLLDSGCFVWDWDIRIIGVDIDQEALAKAGGGVYSGRAFQTTPKHYMKRYFRPCGEGFAVRDNMRGMTEFVHGNLLDLENAVPGQLVDIIFCRNVMIYFNDETIRRIVDSFARMLGHDGLLFLGHSESLARITDRFVPLRFPGTILYRVRD